MEILESTTSWLAPINKGVMVVPEPRHWEGVKMYIKHQAILEMKMV